MMADKAARHTVLQAFSFLSFFFFFFFFFFEINDDIIQNLPMFEILFTQGSEIENLFCGAPSSSDPSVFLSDYFFRLGFKPVQDDFQHDFARMTNEADGSVFLTER